MVVSIPLTDKDLKELPPMMGFHEERYIPQHSKNRESSWTSFYTCICNGKRVYVWAFNSGNMIHEKECCVMVSDRITDPGYKASEAEIQTMFATQHDQQRRRNVRRTFHIPADPLTLQAFISDVTLGGNERVYLEKFNV